jgi:hypothetical protein
MPEKNALRGPSLFSSSWGITDCGSHLSNREVFQEETPCRNRNQLFRRIAWRLQALAEGDLTDRARQRAQEIARDADYPAQRVSR